MVCETTALLARSAEDIYYELGERERESGLHCQVKKCRMYDVCAYHIIPSYLQYVGVWGLRCVLSFLARVVFITYANRAQMHESSGV